MRRFIAFLLLATGIASPALSQPISWDTPTPATTPAPLQMTAPNPALPATPQAPEDAPQPEYEPKKFAILQTLDKVTARTATVTLPIGTPSAVGPIFIEIKACQKTPPTEQPEAAAFLQIWEAKPKNTASESASKSQWVFSGWMFAASPALSAMEHPVYDVWLKDCVNEIAPSKEK